MKRLHLIYLTLSCILLSSCISEGYFGESDLANITTFRIKGQINNSIETGSGVDTGYVYISISNSMNASDLIVEQAIASPLAKFETDPYTLTNFLEPQLIWVRAENDKVVKPWLIVVTKGDAPTQLPYSAMNQWYMTDWKYTPTGSTTAEYAYFPGVNSSSYSPWQTPAQATRFASYFTTVPGPSASNAEFAQITTSTYKLGAVVKAGVIGGALFTGYFRFSTSHAPVIGSDPNPRKMIDFGVPFYQRPKSVTLQMRYHRGAQMVDGSLEPIYPNDSEHRPSVDSCDVYFILQNRTALANNWVRVAAAWLRTSDSIGSFTNSTEGFVEITLPFIYGAPTAAELQEKPYLKIGGTYGEVEFYKFTPIPDEVNEYTKTLMPEVYATTPIEEEPDYIIVLFSSSAFGDRFWGAKDSRLYIKNVTLNY